LPAVARLPPPLGVAERPGLGIGVACCRLQQEQAASTAEDAVSNMHDALFSHLIAMQVVTLEAVKRLHDICTKSLWADRGVRPTLGGRAG
jgi:hypothetical protein